MSQLHSDGEPPKPGAAALPSIGHEVLRIEDSRVLERAVGLDHDCAARAEVVEPGLDGTFDLNKLHEAVRGSKPSRAVVVS